MMGMGKILKQAQQMQEKMVRVQQELASREVEGSAGGGAVVVKASGEQKLLSVVIQPQALQGGDVEMLQDLVLTAANQALENASKLAQAEMSKVTGGMSLPGMGF